MDIAEPSSGLHADSRSGLTTMDARRHSRRGRIGALLLTTCVALVVAGCGGGGDGDSKSSDSKSDSTKADGKSIFSNNCSVCHGVEGEGGQGAPPLKGTMYTESMIVNQVTNGMGGMPAFGDRLSDDEIDAVAKYVASEIK